MSVQDVKTNSNNPRDKPFSGLGGCPNNEILSHDSYHSRMRSSSGDSSEFGGSVSSANTASSHGHSLSGGSGDRKLNFSDKDPLRFIKPERKSSLTDSAREQLELVQERRETIQLFMDDEDDLEWKSNLSNWKNKRRKKSAPSLAIKEHLEAEYEKETSNKPRSTKTFSQMVKDRERRGSTFAALSLDSGESIAITSRPLKHVPDFIEDRLGQSITKTEDNKITVIDPENVRSRSDENNETANLAKSGNCFVDDSKDTDYSLVDGNNFVSTSDKNKEFHESVPVSTTDMKQKSSNDSINFESAESSYQSHKQYTLNTSDTSTNIEGPKKEYLSKKPHTDTLSNIYERKAALDHNKSGLKSFSKDDIEITTEEVKESVRWPRRTSDFSLFEQKFGTKESTEVSTKSSITGRRGSGRVTDLLRSFEKLKCVSESSDTQNPGKAMDDKTTTRETCHKQLSSRDNYNNKPDSLDGTTNQIHSDLPEDDQLYRLLDLPNIKEQVVQDRPVIKISESSSNISKTSEVPSTTAPSRPVSSMTSVSSIRKAYCPVPYVPPSNDALKTRDENCNTLKSDGGYGPPEGLLRWQKSAPSSTSVKLSTDENSTTETYQEMKYRDDNMTNSQANTKASSRDIVSWLNNIPQNEVISINSEEKEFIPPVTEQPPVQVKIHPLSTRSEAVEVKLPIPQRDIDLKDSGFETLDEEKKRILEEEENLLREEQKLQEKRKALASKREELTRSREATSCDQYKLTNNQLAPSHQSHSSLAPQSFGQVPSKPAVSQPDATNKISGTNTPGNTLTSSSVMNTSFHPPAAISTGHPPINYPPSNQSVQTSMYSDNVPVPNGFPRADTSYQSRSPYDYVDFAKNTTPDYYTQAGTYYDVSGSPRQPVHQHWLVQEAEHRRISSPENFAQTSGKTTTVSRDMADEDHATELERSRHFLTNKLGSLSSSSRLQQQPFNLYHSPQSSTSSGPRSPPLQTQRPYSSSNRGFVNGKAKCSQCHDELGSGAAMIIEQLGLNFHMRCFHCNVCRSPLGSGADGSADVRVRGNKLHCHRCYINTDVYSYGKHL